jgi:ABC-type transporter lipoprotein component MlaA
MKKTYNPFRTAYSKLCPKDQLRLVKKLLSPTRTLTEVVNQLTRVDPYVTVQQSGRLSLMSDKHLLNS